MLSWSDLSREQSLGKYVWRASCYPCSRPPPPPPPPPPPSPRHWNGPLERRAPIHMVPVPSQELPERCCIQPQTAAGTPAPDFSSGLTPEAFPMSMAARQRRFETRVVPLYQSSSDRNCGAPVATLPGAWRFRVSAGTGWVRVSMLLLDEIASLICNFLSQCGSTYNCLSRPVRYTGILLGR